jgi:predicted kinase
MLDPLRDFNWARLAVIGIGLPGSGKTTVLREIEAEHAVVYVCPDDIRLALLGDATNQEHNREVWAEAYRRIHAALDASGNVIVDATNAKLDERQDLIRHCRQKASHIVGVWVIAPYETCLRRNRERERRVPEFAIGCMAGWLEARPPSEADGFDRLLRIGST